MAANRKATWMLSMNTMIILMIITPTQQMMITKPVMETMMLPPLSLRTVEILMILTLTTMYIATTMLTMTITLMAAIIRMITTLAKVFILITPISHLQKRQTIRMKDRSTMESVDLHL